MAERYTSQAKEAIKYAEMAAKELSQNYVGTEHLLLGLVQEGSGVAAKILENNGRENLKFNRSAYSIKL